MKNYPLKGDWRKIREQAKVTWGGLTENDLEQVHSYENLVVKIQERYQIPESKAKREVDRFFKEISDVEGSSGNAPPQDYSGGTEGEPGTDPGEW